MASTQPLHGLIKWLGREEWRDEFASVLNDHLLPAYGRTGRDAEEAIAILGKDWFMTTVWGCAFEDFLTREYAEGRNIVDEYLKRRGWNENASARASDGLWTVVPSFIRTVQRSGTGSARPGRHHGLASA